jgi:hypothetical protein
LRPEHLAGVQPTGPVLEARRAEAESNGRLDEAFAWAARAQELAPSRPRLAALIDLALRAERWDDAARAATAPWVTERPVERKEAALEFAWGCIAGGDPRVLEILDAAGQLPPAVCVEVKDVQPCAVCPALEGTGGEPNARREAWQAAQRAAEKTFAASRAALRRRFPVGPLLRVRLDPDEAPTGQRAFVAVVDASRSPFGPLPPKLVEVLEVPALAPPGPNTLVDVWLPVNAPEFARFDLFFAPDAGAAQQAAEARLAKEEGTAPSADVVVSHQRPGAVCGCGL